VNLLETRLILLAFLLAAVGQRLTVQLGYQGWLRAGPHVAAAFLSSMGYFWLLNRIELRTLRWWGMMLTGIVVVARFL
jgi:hypothetical protein